MALTDLLALHDHIAKANPAAATRLVADIQQRCAILREFPLAGRARNDLHPGLRILPLRDQTVIAYLPEADGVAIVRVFHGGQDYETILSTDPEP
jgi:toxin ParE1/3/4